MDGENNDSGQLGKDVDRFIGKPIQLDTLPIKSIACGENASFAVTFENYLFIFGNYINEDIIKCPDDILTICSSKSNDLFLLTRNKELYIFDLSQERHRMTFMKIEFPYKN